VQPKLSSSSIFLLSKKCSDTIDDKFINVLSTSSISGITVFLSFLLLFSGVDFIHDCNDVYEVSLLDDKDGVVDTGDEDDDIGNGDNCFNVSDKVAGMLKNNYF